MARTGTVAMEARQVDGLPDGKGWQYEPKWDGFRCLAWRDGDEVELLGRSGKSLSFEALQMRLHPAASRIRRLAEETPSLLIAFDLLEDEKGRDLQAEPLSGRRAALERFFATLGAAEAFRLSPKTTRLADARRWLSRAGGGALDGVMAKRLDESYKAGERAMLKIKNLRSADCVVGGFRYATARKEGRKEVGSLLLGLYNEAGLLDHVGFTSALGSLDRKALTAKLEKLKGGGFTGDAPGGPSRWSTERTAQWVALKPKLVVEVQYDHVTGRHFRHGTGFLRWRPDKAPRDCSFDQLVQEDRPSRVMRLLKSA